MVAKHVTRKKGWVKEISLLLSILLCNLPVCGFLLSLLTMQSLRHRQWNLVRIRCYTNPTLARRVTHLETSTCKIWPRLRELPGLADWSTLLGQSIHPPCKRNQIKMKMKMKMSGPHQLSAATLLTYITNKVFMYELYGRAGYTT